MDENLMGSGTTLDDAIATFEKSLSDDGDYLLERDSEDEASVDEENAGDEDTTEDESEDVEDDDDEGEDSEDGSESDETPPVNDEMEIEVLVGEEKKVFKLKDLKRLAGQEAALTKKAQALAEARKTLDAHVELASHVLKRQYDKAVERASRYKDVDLYRASRELEPDEFDALKAAKEESEAEVKFLESEAVELLAKTKENNERLLREQAKVAYQEIIRRIPEWNDDLYRDLRVYAVSQGLDKDEVNNLIDPTAFVLIRKAYLYDKAQETKATVKKKVNKVIAKAPKKTVQGSEPSNSKNTSLKALLSRARNSGSIDDVAAAFAASLED